jgi:hypothetical protein
LNNSEAPGSSGAARDWLPALNLYRVPNQFRSLFELVITVVPFALLWILMCGSLHWSYLLSSQSPSLQQASSSGFSWSSTTTATARFSASDERTTGPGVP